MCWLCSSGKDLGRIGVRVTDIVRFSIRVVNRLFHLTNCSRWQTRPNCIVIVYEKASVTKRFCASVESMGCWVSATRTCHCRCSESTYIGRLLSSWRDSSPYLNRTSTTRTEGPQEGNAPIDCERSGSITTACLPEGMKSGRETSLARVCSVMLAYLTSRANDAVKPGLRFERTSTAHTQTILRTWGAFSRPPMPIYAVGITQVPSVNTPTIRRLLRVDAGLSLANLCVYASFYATYKINPSP